MPDPFIDPAALDRSLRSLRAGPGGPRLSDDLDRIMAAGHKLFGATGAGIMMLDEESSLAAVAATDEPARLLEVRQQELGKGPCVDALIFDQIIKTDDLAADARWPELGEELSRAGVRAILGVPVHVSGVAVGSLNVYRDRPDRWDESSTDALRAYASVIAGVLESALVLRDRERLTEQLQHALDHRVVIERAVGVTMARLGVDAVTAFNDLRTTARSSERKLVDVAVELLAGLASSPAPD
jgi:GAF domain-containing protein